MKDGGRGKRKIEGNMQHLSTGATRMWGEGHKHGTEDRQSD